MTLWRVGWLIVALDLAGLGALFYPGWRAESRFAVPPVEAAVPLDYSPPAETPAATGRQMSVARQEQPRGRVNRGGGNERAVGDPLSGPARAALSPLLPPTPMSAGRPRIPAGLPPAARSPTPAPARPTSRWVLLGTLRTTGYVPGAERRRDGTPTIGRAGETCTIPPGAREGDWLHVEGVGFYHALGRPSHTTEVDVAVRRNAVAYRVTGWRRVWILREGER